MGFGGGQILLDEDTFSGRQAVGLEDIGCLKRVEKCLGLGQGFVCKGLVACRRDAVPHHEGLGIVLTALETGTFLAGANDAYMV